MYEAKINLKRIGGEGGNIFEPLTSFSLIHNIVNRGKWLGSPANIKEANKEAKVEVGRSKTVHIFCFALIHYA